MQAKDVMTTAVETVRPDTTVTEVAKRLIARNISAVPVVDDQGQVVGIVSEGDLMHRPESGTERRPSWWLSLISDTEEYARDYIKTHGQYAGEVMTRNVISISEDTPLEEIATTLEKNHIKRVPVLRDGKLVGIVSRSNLLQGLAAARPATAEWVSDSDLKAAIEKAGLSAGVRMAFISVVVADGVVTLWGMVESETEKMAMRVAAESTAGVSEIHDHVNVMPAMVRATLWAE